MAVGSERDTAAIRRRWPVVAAIAAVAAWASLAVLIARMYAGTPPGAGFDLELLLTGGRRVAAGLSPYEPAMLAGQSVGMVKDEAPVAQILATLMEEAAHALERRSVHA